MIFKPIHMCKKYILCENSKNNEIVDIINIINMVNIINIIIFIIIDKRT